MKKTDFKKELNEIDQKLSLENRENDLNRARSVTVGTSFGGTTELMMRMNNGRTVWAPMQPVEVAELIHQLAANIGCHVALKPRNDFASWRQWKVQPHMDAGPGWPPWVNDMEPHKLVGSKMPNALEQPGLNPNLMAPIKETNKEKLLVAQKTQEKPNVKRAMKKIKKDE
jgi:hypothetical protein